MPTNNSDIRFVVYDLETTGIDIPNIQMCQIATTETDSDLNEIGSKEVFVKPRIDMVPSPYAFLVTGIDIDVLQRVGKPEIEAITELQNDFLSKPNTVILGYNTGSYDNELIRHTLYRNLKNPYQHEWLNNNRHVDLYPLVQMVYAFSPSILNWPVKEDGSVSLKLEDLAKENGIIHENAHDASSDVSATIALAKLIKERNPNIWDHALWLSNKKNCASLVADNEVVFHTSRYFGKESRMTKPVAPIIPDLKNNNKRFCIDLSADPEDLKLLLQLTPEQIREYCFTKKEDLPEGSPNMPITNFQINKSPNIVQANPAAIRKRADAFGYNAQNVQENLRIVNENRSLLKRLIQEAMIAEFPEPSDPYLDIYGGFASKNDDKILQNLHSRDPNHPEKTVLTETPIKELVQPLENKKKYGPMILRAKYYNYLEDLIFRNKAPVAELKRMMSDLTNRTQNGHGGALTFKEFHSQLKTIRQEKVLDEREEATLDSLEKYVNRIEKEVIPEIQREIKNIELENNKDSYQP